MRNIHILPTEKPSRLFKYNNELGLSKGFQNGSNTILNQNTYITNDEEIKDGDYFYSLFDGVERILKYNKLVEPIVGDKKIILTTDQDLIAYGIEQISENTLLKIIEHINSGKDIESFDKL